MRKTNGRPDEGQIVATYRRGNLMWICRIANGYYCATFHVRQTNVTYYSKDKNEINNLIRKQLADGFKKV